MSDPGGLFGELPEQVAPAASGEGSPRLREARRDQLELRPLDLESLIPLDHPARSIWAFAEQLDLSELLAGIKAREGEPGRPPADPKILMALWLYATVDGEGSARAVARQCEQHAAYRWICGGVSMNHHTLSDFRLSQEALLDRLLAKGVAALVSAGLVSLTRLGQDGVRVRAAAGLKSFRRRERLGLLLKDAEARVAQLKSELQADPGRGRTRREAAQARAAQEQVARTKAALERVEQLEADRRQRAKTLKKAPEAKKPPKASTTDSEARRMRMGDGGFRPAYNVQFVSDPATQVIVAVAIDTTGSDGGLMAPMLDQVETAYGAAPETYLVDGGFTKREDIEAAHAAGIKVYTPPPRPGSTSDLSEPKDEDGPGVKAWRERMASEEAKPMARERSKIECINADLRNRGGLGRLLVRGKRKVRTVLLWFALAHNVLRAAALRAASAGAHPAMAAG